MAELSFGEKLLIARKQLDLYQYEMAERLGVHPNSIWKYERGEGKPHAAVVRMLDLLCEKHNIRLTSTSPQLRRRDEDRSGREGFSGNAGRVCGRAGVEVLTHDQLPDGLQAALADADALVVRSAVQVDDALMEHAPSCEWWQAGVGVDNIDADAATRRGVVVMNTPGANAGGRGRADHWADAGVGSQSARGERVDARRQVGEEESARRGVARQDAGHSGAGAHWAGSGEARQGIWVGDCRQRSVVSAAVARENGIKLVTLDELIAGSDYITLHVGLTPQTAGVINAKSLAAMKKGVRIVNCARGELIEDVALVEALKSGQVAGAALDVFVVEPAKNSPYAELDNVILTPHIAGSTAEAQEAVGIQIAMQVREYLKLGVVQNAVNLPSLSHEEYVVLGALHRPGRAAGFVSGADGQRRH